MDSNTGTGGHCHQPFTHVLLRVTLTAGDLSSVEVASDKMKATSRCITRASTEDSHYIHTPPRPRVTDPIGEGDPKPQAPVSDWGVCFRRGDFFFKVYEHLKIV